jgi:hypothetical protein
MFQVEFYKSIFNRSFFFDKCSFISTYQCPKIKSINIKVGAEVCSKFFYYKLLIFFYLITGQKPSVLIRTTSLRGIKKKKVMGCFLTLKKFDLFLNFFVFRQLSLIPFFKFFLLKKAGTSISFLIKQRTHDDDLLSQLLKIYESFSYYVVFQTTAITPAHLQTLLTNFKIPNSLK